MDCPSLLPTAFYKCALLGGDVVCGYRREDNTIEYLRRRDLKRCIDGRNALAERAVSVVAEVFGNAYPCGDCASHDRCRGALLALTERVVEDVFASEADVLMSWAGRIHEWAEDLALCELCKKAVIARDGAARRQVWDDLPSIFGIRVEGWVKSEDGEEATGTETA